jgi:hypothetical protein
MNRFLLGALIGLCVCLPATAKPVIIPGDEAQQRVERLTSEIRWMNDLNQARSAARQEGKLIFWVQMLGEMSGGT